MPYYLWVLLFSITSSFAMQMTIVPKASIKLGAFDEGAAEISAFDPLEKKIFVTNAEKNGIDVISLNEDLSLSHDFYIDCSPYGGGINSVAFKNNMLVAAIEANVKQDPGLIVVFDGNGNYLKEFEAGALPDMVTFSPNGKYILSANEGEPNDSYTVDPEGSVTIVNISAGLHKAKARQVSFGRFNKYKKWLLHKGVRIYGPGASVAQDLEPEYITVDANNRFAYVSLQENNALAVIDIKHGYCIRILPLGLKDFSEPGYGLDASDKDDKININNWPVYGMYMPDAISSYNFKGRTFIVTANEGDSRDYDGYSEELRVKDLELDPAIFGDVSELQSNENLGRLKTTSALNKFNDQNQVQKILSYGARSFSIFTHYGKKVYDSGDDFEKITSSVYVNDFNSTNDENGSFDGRSDDKGPEPEALVLGEINGKTIAFIGLERIGGIMAYDITNPRKVKFLNYVNNRNFNVEAESEEAGDLGVEGLVFVNASQSPSHKPLLISSNEISGTISVFEIGELGVQEPVTLDRKELLNHEGVQIYHGGLGSGMAAHPYLAGYFYLMTDRGPNVNGVKENGNSVKIFPVPEFTPEIGLFRLNGNRMVKTSSLPIKNPEGYNITGLPNPIGTGSTGEIAKDLDGNYLGEDVYGLDPEGLVASKDGSFWLSDEYGPHIVHLDAEGKTIERINPYGTGEGGRKLPSVLKRRRANRGMEGLTQTPSGKLVGIMQSSLDNPSSAVRSTSAITRILWLDPVSGKSKQFLYMQDAPGLSNSEIRSLGESKFVVLERDGGFPSDGSNYKEFYIIDMEKATDVSDISDSEDGLMIGGKTLEECSLEEIKAAGIVPVKKKLLFSALNGMEGYSHDKPEGFEYYPESGLLAIINDDDFGILGDNSGGIVPKVLPLTNEVDRNIMYFVNVK